MMGEQERRVSVFVHVNGMHYYTACVRYTQLSNYYLDYISKVHKWRVYLTNTNEIWQ